MKTHKLYELKLKEAKRQKREIEAQIQKCRSKLHESLLGNRHGQAEQLQQILESLQRKLTLAQAKVEAVENTRSAAETESTQAKEDLEKALPIVKNLSARLPEEWTNLLQQLEGMLSTVDEFSTGYEVLRDKHYEVTYLADLTDKDVSIPPLFQLDVSPLPEAAHRLKNAAELATSGNAQIRWGGRIAELDNVRNKEQKKKTSKKGWRQSYAQRFYRCRVIAMLALPDQNRT